MALSESTLATTAVNDGFPDEPGAGWISSAYNDKLEQSGISNKNVRTPIIIVGLVGSVRIETERGSGIVLIPPSFTLILEDIRGLIQQYQVRLDSL